jgi:hypothetical protein
MRTGVIIDDQDHALRQIENEFPKDEWPNWNFIHFDTFELFKKQKLNNVDVVFLDFFLSKDRIYGIDILPEVKSRILVCFSSKKEMSDAMADDAVRNGLFKFKDVYSVRKIKENIANPELRRVLAELVSRLAKEGIAPSPISGFR